MQSIQAWKRLSRNVDDPEMTEPLLKPLSGLSQTSPPIVNLRCPHCGHAGSCSGIGPNDVSWTAQANLTTAGGGVWLVLTVSKCLPAGPLFAVGSPESAAPHLSKTCPAYNSTPGTLTCARDLIRGPRAALDHPKSTLQPNLRTPLRCL